MSLPREGAFRERRLSPLHRGRVGEGARGDRTRGRPGGIDPPRAGPTTRRVRSDGRDGGGAAGPSGERPGSEPERRRRVRPIRAEVPPPTRVRLRGGARCEAVPPERRRPTTYPTRPWGGPAWSRLTPQAVGFRRSRGYAGGSTGSRPGTGRPPPPSRRAPSASESSGRGPRAGRTTGREVCGSSASSNWISRRGRSPRSPRS